MDGTRCPSPCPDSASVTVADDSDSLSDSSSGSDSCRVRGQRPCQRPRQRPRHDHLRVVHADLFDKPVEPQRHRGHRAAQRVFRPIAGPSEDQQLRGHDLSLWLLCVLRASVVQGGGREIRNPKSQIPNPKFPGGWAERETFERIAPERRWVQPAAAFRAVSSAPVAPSRTHPAWRRGSRCRPC